MHGCHVSRAPKTMVHFQLHEVNNLTSLQGQKLQALPSVTPKK